MKHIKLWESFSREQREFLHGLRDQFGLDGHGDALELMLNWAAEKLSVLPEEIVVKEVDEKSLRDLLHKKAAGSVIDLEAFGLGDGGIHQLRSFTINTQEEYIKLRDDVARENPELASSRDEKAWWKLHEIRTARMQREYGAVVATGPAGNFILTPRTRKSH